MYIPFNNTMSDKQQPKERFTFEKECNMLEPCGLCEYYYDMRWCHSQSGYRFCHSKDQWKQFERESAKALERVKRSIKHTKAIAKKHKRQ